MANQNLLLSRTFLVSSDHNGLSAATDQFIFVHQSDEGDYRVAQAETNDRCLGVSQEISRKDTGIAVGMIGITKLRLGGTVTRGQPLRSDTNGDAVRWLGAAASHIGAIALQNGVDDEVIEAFLTTGFTIT